MNKHSDIANEDVLRIAAYCKASLELGNIRLTEEYTYPSLALIVIDTIFSIGVHYNSTKNTVARFRQYTNIDGADPSRLEKSREFTISNLIDLYTNSSVELMAKNVYQNLQRTSTRNGILKSEAVLEVSKLLLRHGVDNIADAQRVIGDGDFEKDFKHIPGQQSGVSLHYFYMLVGSESEIKPDRMILRFLSTALSRNIQVEECHPLLVRTCHVLAAEYPDLQPRLLDNAIWQFQRQQKQSEPSLVD